MAMTQIVALKLLAFFAIFVVAAFLLPIWRLWRREKVNAFVVPFDDTAEGVIGRSLRLTLLALPILLAAIAMGLPPDSVGSLPWLAGPAPRFAGWTLLLVSLAWVIAGQTRMGKSWRVGIDSQARPPLVQDGVFALSRNPIFLGVRAGLLGVFLVLPNAATLAALLLGEAMIQVQVRLEEAHLARVFPRQYEAYRRKVRRWL